MVARKSLRSGVSARVTACTCAHMHIIPPQRCNICPVNMTFQAIELQKPAIQWVISQNVARTCRHGQAARSVPASAMAAHSPTTCRDCGNTNYIARPWRADQCPACFDKSVSAWCHDGFLDDRMGSGRSVAWAGPNVGTVATKHYRRIVARGVGRSVVAPPTTAPFPPQLRSPDIRRAKLQANDPGSPPPAPNSGSSKPTSPAGASDTGVDGTETQPAAATAGAGAGGSALGTILTALRLLWRLDAKVHAAVNATRREAASSVPSPFARRRLASDCVSLASSEARESPNCAEEHVIGGFGGGSSLLAAVAEAMSHTCVDVTPGEIVVRAGSCSCMLSLCLRRADTRLQARTLPHFTSLPLGRCKSLPRMVTLQLHAPYHLGMGLAALSSPSVA